MIPVKQDAPEVRPESKSIEKSQAYACELLNTALREKLGRSQREVLLTELAASAGVLLRDGKLTDKEYEEQLRVLVATFELRHWMKHYKRGRKFHWRHAGRMQAVTCLDVKPEDRKVVLLDKDNKRHEIEFKSPEDLKQLEDEEQIALRQLRKEVARQDAKIKQLESRLESILKQHQTTLFKVQKLRKQREKIKERLSKIENLYLDKRHRLSKIVGKVDREELRHVARK